MAASAARTPGLITPSTGTGNVCAQVIQSKGAGGVAGHHHHLHAQFHQQPGILAGEGAHGALALGAVGNAGGVAEVDQILAGQTVMQGAQDGQPAQPRIEDPDGSLLGLRLTYSHLRGSKGRSMVRLPARVSTWAPSTRMVQLRVSGKFRATVRRIEVRVATSAVAAPGMAGHQFLAEIQDHRVVIGVEKGGQGPGALGEGAHRPADARPLAQASA